jgi:hypothetical protein
VPMNLFESVEIASQQITTQGVFSSRGNNLLLAALGGQPALIRQLMTREGLGFADSPPQVQEAMRLFFTKPYSVLGSPVDPESARWRIELHPDPAPAPWRNIDGRSDRWRYRRQPSRWSGQGSFFVRIAGEQEINTGTLYLRSPDLEFLPPPPSPVKKAE